jgi:hypothetical protein
MKGRFHVASRAGPIGRDLIDEVALQACCGHLRGSRAPSLQAPNEDKPLHRSSDIQP